MRFLKIVASLWIFNFSVLAAELPQSSTASFLQRWETSSYLKDRCLVALHGLCCERISICKSPSAMWGPGRAAHAQEKVKQHSEKDLNAKESGWFTCFGPIWEQLRTNMLAWCPLHGSSPCTLPPTGWDWGFGDLAFVFLAHQSPDCGSPCLTLCPTRLQPLRSPKAREWKQFCGNFKTGGNPKRSKPVTKSL